MKYVITSLKAEIKSLKLYIEHCKDRLNTFGLEETTQKKYKREVTASRKQIQSFRDAIKLLNEYKKVKRQ